jgi:hypothetical protein
MSNHVFLCVTVPLTQLFDTRTQSTKELALINHSPYLWEDTVG